MANIISDSKSGEQFNFSSARITKRLPSQCASAIQIVRPVGIKSLRTQPQLQPALLRLSAQNACQKENGRISTTPFLLSHFSPGDKIENCSAQFLAVCWIVRVEFKVHRLRDGFSVSNALLLDQSLPALLRQLPQ